MPLHDWKREDGWGALHQFWITELARSLKRRLPAGYRAFLGTAPRLAIGDSVRRPDIGVKLHPDLRPPGHEPPTGGGGTLLEMEPDFEVAVERLDYDIVLFIEQAGWLVAAVEIISPRNKDRNDSKDNYLNRYLGYLLDGVHLLLIDLLPKPYDFSFADEIAREFGLDQPKTPSPYAVSYRVGESAATGGRLLAVWRRPMTVGQPLPTIPLPLTVHEAVAVDLEATYAAAASDAYLD
ncbi:DUF4058 family protein [Tautonia rosea]|uniref:DUF4058 family protein n=1 Tax=Tautonia rosea TaxID=2728037 RepID=UPI00147371C0|nr:DUF4058 family protein [Tautonia rosea]